MSAVPADTASLFAGPGAMRARCREHGWGATLLGEPAEWTRSLRSSVSTMLGVGFPMIILWGPELAQIFNDGYRPFLGAKELSALGQPTRECWPEVWHINAPIYARVRAGETVTLEEAHFPVRRQAPDGPVEDLYITLSYSPVLDDDEQVGGVLVTLFDATAKVTARMLDADRERLARGLEDASLDNARLLERISDAYILLDSDFRIVAMNQSAERVLGVPRSAIIGRIHWEAFPASVAAESERQYRLAIRDQVEVHFTHHYVGEGYDMHTEIDAYPTADGGLAVFWRDVSERVRLVAHAEAARLDAEARAATLAAVIESLPDAVIVARADAVVLANRVALEQLGVASVNDLRGTRPPLDEVLLDQTSGEPLPTAATPLGHAFSGKPSHAYFLLRSGQDTRPVRVSAAPILSPNGAISGAVAVVTDMSATTQAVSERDRLLAELGAERTLLRTVLDQLPAAVFVVEAPSGRVLALNDAVTQVWGGERPHTDAVERYSAEWVGYHMDGRRIESSEWPVARAAAGETITGWTGEIERGDGSRALIEVSAAPVRDTEGRIVAAVAVAADITARAHAARDRERLLGELEVERARLAYVFQRAPAFLAVLRGPTHIVQFVNDAYRELVGDRELIGLPAHEAIPEARDQGLIALVDGVLATGEPFVGREVPIRLIRTPGGEPEVRYLDFSYLPMVEADGTRSGIIAHGTDVTAHVEARREVERLLGESERARADAEAARAEAELANRSKSEFLAVMSHELRTPLNAIGGYAELIEMGIRGAVTDAQRADLGRIQKSQRHLLGLINGVLNYAKVDAGAVHYEVTDVPVAEVLTTCEALVRPQADLKRIEISFVQCDEAVVARADREKVQQVMLNLLSNAVKFTEHGGSISLSCAREIPPDNETPRVVARVTDTGRGIAQEQLERVFQPFVQVDAALTRVQEGTGLGLAISRDLARGMGGDLTVTSEEGRGSTFTVFLPSASG